MEAPRIPEPETSLDEAREARRVSEAGLQQAIGDWAPVRAVSSALRDHGVQNHFAERMGAALREKRP